MVRQKSSLGQASFEQLIVIALGLALISVMFYLAATYTSDSLRISQAEDAVGQLAAAADYVYSLGPNSKEYVDVYLPEGIRNIIIDGKRLVISIDTSSGSSDLFATTRSDLIGTLPTARGKQKILVQYLESGKVLIGEAGLSCSPSVLTRTFNASQGGTDSISLSNNAEFNISNITVLFEGTATSLATVTPPPDTLAPGANGSVTVTYSVPAGWPAGTYSGTVLFESANDGACVTNVNIHVQGEKTCGGLCIAQGYTEGTCRDSLPSCIANSEDHSASNDYACLSPTPVCCCGPTLDNQGPVVSIINSTPLNATSTTQITINAVCNDSLTGGSYISSAQVRIDNGNWSNLSAVDGAFMDATVENVNASVGAFATGQHVAWVQCTDSAGNAGPVSYYYFTVSDADIVGPIVVQMNHTDYPTTLANITLGGVASDAYTGNSNLKGCKLKLDSGEWADVDAVDGAWDSPIENYTYNAGQLPVGYHTVYVQCTDAYNNTGGIFNDSFGVVDVDLMVVLDRSGSMAWNVTNSTYNTVVSTTNTGFTFMKNITVTAKNGNLVNISVELYASASGCTAYYEVRYNGTAIASGNRTGTTYAYVTNTGVNISGLQPPYTLSLYGKRSAGPSCTAYFRGFSVQQLPVKMSAAQNSSKTFVDIVSDSTNAGLVSYSNSATLNKQLALMGASNKTALKNAIDSLSPSGSTCIQCGLQTAADELTSARGRANATRVIILLTDGVSTTGDSVAGSVYCRDRNITVYTIGFGDDVDDVELTNIALLTHGAYYFAPDAQTLMEIFMNIGK